MQQSEIKRGCLIAVSQWEPETLTLADEAISVLNYDGLKEAQSEITDMEPLAAVLAHLQMEILNKEDVEAYQKERVLEQAQIDFAEWIDKKEHRYSFISQTWDKTVIEKYNKPVPEFVLNKAIQIKKAMPEVRIYVEELKRDPFLIVATAHKEYSSLDAEAYYIEVWEEPKFEGRLR